MRILGIETSCDETGVAIYDSKKNKILSETLFSQASKHAEYGGVVPELASRDHIRKLLPLIEIVMSKSKLKSGDIDCIAYTSGPGLRGPLLTGAALAVSLGQGWNKPSIGVHHMEAHLLINLLEVPSPKFPFLALLISGGHCLLIKAKDIGKYELLGETRDDAIGEAFDKVAKLLGLNYPGGPEVEKVARQGDPFSYDLPKPMIKKEHLDFSFSGLKTAVYYLVKKEKKINKKFISNICASFQYSISEILIEKCKKALSNHNLDQLVAGGGVAANQYIRNRLDSELKGIDIFYPRLERCTDNGAMIAVAGFHRFQESKKDTCIKVRSNWSLSEI